VKITDWFKRLLKSRIYITIENHIDGIQYTGTPRVVETLVDSPNIVRKAQSNYRFVEEVKTDRFGQPSTCYFTEEYEDGRWKFISSTLSFSKTQAMDMHIQLIEARDIVPTFTKTVLWEGLNKEETKAWAQLHR
jgi:hypothetical protein